MKSEQHDLVAQNEVEEQPTKKPYTTPQMTVYGTVEKITEALSGGGSDAPLGGGSRL